MLDLTKKLTLTTGKLILQENKPYVNGLRCIGKSFFCFRIQDRIGGKKFPQTVKAPIKFP